MNIAPDIHTLPKDAISGKMCHKVSIVAQKAKNAKSSTKAQLPKDPILNRRNDDVNTKVMRRRLIFTAGPALKFIGVN